MRFAASCRLSNIELRVQNEIPSFLLNRYRPFLRRRKLSAQTGPAVHLGSIVAKESRSECQDETSILWAPSLVPLTFQFLSVPLWVLMLLNFTDVEANSCPLAYL